jgi:hypothetical protein
MRYHAPRTHPPRRNLPAAEDAAMAEPNAPHADARQAELPALLAVLRGLRALAEGRLSGLAIAPGEYLADLYALQRVATLLAMELAAAGRSLRRDAVREAGDEVHAIEAALAAAFTRRGLRLEDCVLDLAQEKVVQRDGRAP